jgi:glucose/arabinose dehydrogenase
MGTGSDDTASATTGGIMERFFKIAAVMAWAVGSIARGAILDSNFTETPFASVGSELTGMAWAPDGSGRLFITKKAGDVVIVKDGTLLATPFATVSPVYTAVECGVIGICFDPNFMVNGYVYLFVTVSSSQQQIIRYTAVGDVGMNKTVLVSGLPTAGSNHDGGGIGIGPDGKLYWSIGDNGNGTGVNADLSSLASKVSRANLDGTAAADNPFADGPGGNNDYIWARGFRNPFTFTFHPITGDLWLNCVGTTYEQIFLVHAGDHAGWNLYENNQPAGYIKPKIKYLTNGTDTRNIAASGVVRNNNVATFTTTVVHGFRQGEKLAIAGVGDSSFNGSFYVAFVPNDTTFTVMQTGPNATSGGGTATTLNQGGCVTGGAFFDSTAVPSGYRENFFYGDYNSGRIMRATLDATNGITSVDYFGTGSVNQIDIAIGPDGALYYGNLGGTINRVAYDNYAGQQLVVTPTVVRMVEGGTASFNVRLGSAPPGDLVVNVARTSGSANINVSQGATLTFLAEDWSRPQVVTLTASADGNSTDDTASFTVSAPGVSSEIMTVHAVDLAASSASFSLAVISPPGKNPPTPAQIRLTGQPGSTYVLQGNSNLTSPWQAISTNTLTGTSTNITDPASTTAPIRFYRARLMP